MSGRGEREGDITIVGEQVALTKSTRITGSVNIKGDVLITGELVVDGPCVISGNVTIQPGSIVDVEGHIIHNGELEQSKRADED